MALHDTSGASCKSERVTKAQMQVQAAHLLTNSIQMLLAVAVIV
jgi:hypothetical protein